MKKKKKKNPSTKKASKKKAAGKKPASIQLRHALATLAYRGGKAVKGAPSEFASFKAGLGTRTPGEILAHIGDLLDWSLHLAEGTHVWKPEGPRAWDEEVTRFFAGLMKLDRRLASSKPLQCEPERFFQGPLADALTHVGQINMLRRMAGSAVKGENYFRAEIRAGTVGAAQAKPKFEFD